MSEYLEALEEVAEAAGIICHVTSNSYKRTDAPKCPHGNIPRYPTHAWWCDDCWQRLEHALDAVDKNRNARELGFHGDLASSFPDVADLQLADLITQANGEEPPSA